MSLITPDRRPGYQPALAWSTTLGGLWVYVLILLGAFTTSIGAGMVFPDWPLSNGSLNPEGWLRDLAMFAEHSHRLSAALMALITMGLAGAIWLREPRAWVRRTAWSAVALVWIQALVGGLRVLFDHLHVEMVNTSMGRLFAMVHATLAQIFVCLLLLLALALSRPWIEPLVRPAPLSQGLRRLAAWCFGLLVLQLAIAAIMRHSYAGLAIATFPFSGPDGALLPPWWNFRIGIHFAHRVMALVLTVVLLTLAWKVWRSPAVKPGERTAAGAVAVLLGLQVYLGATVIWSYRHPHLTTAHVVVGALLLATTFGLAAALHRPNLAPDVKLAGP
jgi:cytochrome c oxidase assembly protein subunit 15